VIARETTEPGPVRHASRWGPAAWFAVAAVALSALYLWSYSDALGTFFVHDDYRHLANNARIHVRTPGDLAQFFRPTESFLLYRPVMIIYYHMLNGLFGTDPGGFHAVHLGFHLANALLVYAIATRLLFSPPLAIAVALVYAAAPGHAYAAYWIGLFTVTGGAFFYYLGLWTWLRLPGRWRGPVTFALFVMALLAGEHAVTFPLALTLAALLVDPQPDWRRLAREQAGFYALLALYLAGKVYLFGFLAAGGPPNNPAAAEVWTHNRMSFAPQSVLTMLGRYLAFGLGPLYDPDRSAPWVLALGVLVAALAAVAVVSVRCGWWTSRPLRVGTFGLALFVVALGPVVVLPTHVLSSYVGVAMFGLALAVVGFAAAVPRVPGVTVTVLVALLLAVHVGVTVPRVRQGGELLYLRSFAETAARWLYALASLDDPSAVEEVVMPADPLTHAVFGQGDAQRVFLCASYRVRLVPAIAEERPASGRVVLPGPVATLPRDCPGWRCVRRDCPSSRLTSAADDRGARPGRGPATVTGAR
jgi:hypothetical protein